MPDVDRIRFYFSQAVKASSVSIASTLSCSVEIEDRSEVVAVLLTDEQGRTQSHALRAGQDTAEWAYDCVTDIRHRRAKILESWEVKREGRNCEGHRYYTNLAVEPKTYVGLELLWKDQPGAIDIKHISLSDEATGYTYPLNANDLTSGDPRWQYIETIDNTMVYENRRAMPRAWLVPEVLSAGSKEILETVHTSKLPDGRAFHPESIALVEKPFQYKATQEDSEALAVLVGETSSRVEVRTSSKSPQFLVLSDTYYPGWRAYIDSDETEVFQTNYILRGVMVPAGRHVVTFEFKPKTFYLGIIVSLMSGLALAGVCFKVVQTRKRDG